MSSGLLKRGKGEVALVGRMCAMRFVCVCGIRERRRERGGGVVRVVGCSLLLVKVFSEARVQKEANWHLENFHTRPRRPGRRESRRKNLKLKRHTPFRRRYRDREGGSHMKIV